MSQKQAPTSYVDLIDVLDALPLLVRETRRRRGLSVRGAACEIGMSFATVTRVEHGQDVVVSNAIALLRWIAEPR